MDMAASADTDRFLYGEQEYAEVASIVETPEDRLKALGLDKEIILQEIMVQFKGKNFHPTGTSGWPEIYEAVLNSEDDEKDLEERLKKERLTGSIKQRISTLKRIGHDEGISPSEKSGNLLNEFFIKRMIKNQPSIFLLDNGNFRALWKGEKGEQLGLQFLPDGNIQFVIFAHRTGTLELARSYGIDTPQGINQMVEVNRLRTLLYS